MMKFALIYLLCCIGHSLLAQNQTFEGVIEVLTIAQQNENSKKALADKLNAIGMYKLAEKVQKIDSIKATYFFKGDSLWAEQISTYSLETKRNYYQANDYALIINPSTGLKIVLGAKPIENELDAQTQKNSPNTKDLGGWLNADYSNYKRIKNRTKIIEGYTCTLYQEYNPKRTGSVSLHWIAEDFKFAKNQQQQHFFNTFFTPFGLKMSSEWQSEGISQQSSIIKIKPTTIGSIQSRLKNLTLGTLDSLQYADEDINQHLKGKNIENASIVPDFSFYPVGKPEPVNLYTQRGSGKFMLLDLWATWCGPCIKDFPIIRQLGEKNAATLEIIGLNTGDHREDFVQNFIQKNNMSWQQAYAGRALGSFLNPSKTIPFVVLLDDQMKIRWVGNPAQHWGEIESIIRNH